MREKKVKTVIIILIMGVGILLIVPVTPGAATYVHYVDEHYVDSNSQGLMINFENMQSESEDYTRIAGEDVGGFPLTEYAFNQTVKFNNVDPEELYDRYRIVMDVIDTGFLTLSADLYGSAINSSTDQYIDYLRYTGTHYFTVTNKIIPGEDFYLRFERTPISGTVRFDIKSLKIVGYDDTDPLITEESIPEDNFRVSSLSTTGNNQITLNFSDNVELDYYKWDFDNPVPTSNVVSLSGTTEIVTFGNGSPVNETEEWENLVEGNHTIYWTVYDVDGNSYSTNWPFEKDATPPSTPTISSENHTEGIWTTDKEPIFYLSGATDGVYGEDGIAGYSIAIDEVPDNIIETDYTSFQMMGMSDGNYTFYVSAVDKSHPANVGDPATFNLCIDTSFQIDSSPAVDDGYSSDYWSNDNTPTFHWTACSDNYSGLLGYYYSVDDPTPETGGIYTTETTITLVPQSDGSHAFYVVAVDNLGHYSRVENDTFLIDATPSDGTTPDDYIEGWSTETGRTFNWTAVEDDADILGYWFAVDDPNPELNGVFTTETDVIVIISGEGIHTFYLCVENGAGANVTHLGLISEITNHTCYIDTTPPPQPNPDDRIEGSSSIDTPTFTWTASTDLSGIQGYWYAVDDPNPELNGVFTTDFSVVLTPQSEGSHVFYIKALNGAGLFSSLGSHSFVIVNPTTTTTTSDPTETSETTTEQTTTEQTSNPDITTTTATTVGPDAITPNIPIFTIIPIIALMTIIRRKKEK